MRRWFVVLFMLLLPLQSAWSVASAYCQHETTERQSQHVGHHAHVHQGEAKKVSGSPLIADADCAACHASAAAVMATELDRHDFAIASGLAKSVASPPFTSALARAPDRPQWLRLV
jgi:hypothetical protein